MADLNSLMAQAISAVNAGADPDAVNARLKQLAVSKGWADDTTVFNIQPDAPPLTKQTKQEYNGLVVPSVLREASQQPNSPAPFANVQAGSKADTFNNVEAGADTDYHPEVEDPRTKDILNTGDAIARNVGGTLQKGLAGVEGIAGGILSYSPIVPRSVSDEAMRVARETNKAGNEKLNVSSGIGGVLGQGVGALSGSWLTSPMTGGMDTLENGGSLTEAELRSLRSSVVNAAMGGAGALGSQAKGILPYLSRVGSQATVGTAATAVDKAIDGQVLTPEDIATNVGGALLGGMGRHEKIAKAAPDLDIPKTGDAAIDAGADFAKSFMTDKKVDLGTIDVSKQKPFTVKMATEFAYKAPELPKTDVNIETSPLDAAKSLQDSIDRRAARARAQTADVLGPLENAQDISRAAIEEPTADVVQPEIPAYTPLHTSEMENLRRDLQVEQATKEAVTPPQPEGVDVNVVPPEDNFMRPSQRKLGKQSLVVDDTGATVPVQKFTKTSAPPVQSLQEAISAAKANRANLNLPANGIHGDFYNPDKVPQHWKQRLDEGTMTFKDVLDDVIHGKGTAQHPQVVEFAKAVKDFESKLGGGDVTYHGFSDEDNTHTSYLLDRALKGQDVPAGYYSQQEHKVRLDKDTANVHAFLHEGTHAVTARAIEAGRRGKLTGDAALAYTRLENLYKEISPAVKEAASKDKEIRQHQTYGLDSMHEFVTEVFTNPAFRAHLKSIPLEPIAEKSQGRTRAGIAVIRNKYQEVVATIRQMLGMSPKADTVLDAVISGSHDFFNKVDTRETPAAGGSRLNLPRTSEEEGLQKPRGKLAQFGRQLLTSGGLEPKATAARRMRSGIVAEGNAEAAQSGNRLAAVATPENRPHIAAALEGNKTAYDKLDSRAKDVVKKEWENNFDRSIASAEAIASNPHATPEQIAHATTIVKYAGKFQTRVYQANEVKGYMADKLKAAAKGDVEAQNDVNAARGYLENQWLPDTDKLAERSTEELEDLYKFHTGHNPDTQFKGKDSSVRKEEMTAAVAEKLRSLTNRGGVLDAIVKDAAGLGDKGSNLKQYYSGLRTGSDVFSELKNVPPEMRKFWGEVSEPIARNVATVRKQYSYLANIKAQNQLRATGMGSIFSADRNGVHTETLSGDKLGSLQGLFTTPDVKRAIDSVFTTNAAMGDLLDASLSDSSGVNMMVNAAAKITTPIRAAAGLTKLASVLGNAGNFVNNFIGSHLQLLSNGNVNPASWAKGMKTMGELLLNERKQSMSEDVRDAYKYGLVEFSHIQELQGNANSARIKQYIKDASQSPNPVVWLKRKAAVVPELYKELYGAMDLWTKMANWHNELGYQTKLNERRGSPLSAEEVKQLTAERVNDTNITPSLAPALLKGAERYGITRFGTYYAEVARTTKNNIAYGAKDFAEGIKTGDYDLARYGLQRSVGAWASVVAQNKQFAALAKVVAGTMGLAYTQLDKDDPRKKYMEKDQFLKSTDPITLSDPSHPEDGEYVYDLSRPDPYGPISTPIRNMLEAIHAGSSGDSKAATDKASLALSNIGDLWTSPNSMWKAAKNALAGNQPAFAHNSPEFYKTSMARLTSLPGVTVGMANGFMDAMTPIVPKSLINYLQSKDVQSPALKDIVLSGVGVTKFDLAKDISNYLGNKSVSDIKASRSDYLDLMKQDFESSPERLESAFNSTMKKAAEPYEKLRLAVQAARAQGTSRSELTTRLKATGVSPEMLATLLRDKPLKVIDLVGDLKSDLNKDLIDNMKDGAEKREAMRRYNYNTRQMNALIRHNRTTDIDSL